MRTEVGKPCANHELVWALEICQLCGDPCFAGAAVSLVGYQRKFPVGTSISHHRPNECFVEDQFDDRA
jgi:hypothetical protein